MQVLGLEKNVHWKYWEKEKQVRNTQVEIEFSLKSWKIFNFLITTESLILAQDER